MRLYSVASPRDGERPSANNLALTVKRDQSGVCSNYLCDLQKGDKISLAGPFGATFLMPDDSEARLIMICTGTGSAPFRGFTMRRQRAAPDLCGHDPFSSARAPLDLLPYFGPLAKVPENFLKKHFLLFHARSGPGQVLCPGPACATRRRRFAAALSDERTHIYLSAA